MGGDEVGRYGAISSSQTLTSKGGQDWQNNFLLRFFGPVVVGSEDLALCKYQHKLDSIVLGPRAFTEYPIQLSSYRHSLTFRNRS